MSNTDDTPAGSHRRGFLRGAALAAVAAPILSEAHFARAAQAQAPVGTAVNNGLKMHGQGRHAPPPGAVLINANENPLGPCQAACSAISAMGPLGGRYDILGETEMLAETFAAQNGLPVDHVAVYAGSSEPLHYTVLAFTSPERGLVTANPSYEAPWEAAATTRAPVKKVALRADHAHDLPAMLAADPAPGVIYVCNPNNPTGTLTPKEDIVRLIDAKPKGTVVLVDEAYIHLADTPDVLDQVRAGKDVIVLRTFSKIYGMAGIRCGFAVGRPDLLARLQPFGQNAMPITGSAAARASLEDSGLVPMRRKLIGDTRRTTLARLKAGGYRVIGDPQSNCFMVDTGRDGRGVIAAMQAKNVYIGRTWPIWPNVVRITVGLPEEMDKFAVAFDAVMKAPPVAGPLPAAASRGAPRDGRRLPQLA